MHRDPHRRPTHPGELLREDVIPAAGTSRLALADQLGLSLQKLDDILNERAPVTPEIAEGLANLMENSFLFWRRMQDAHDRFGLLDGR